MHFIYWKEYFQAYMSDSANNKQVTFCRECLRNKIKIDPDRFKGTAVFEGIKIIFPSWSNCGPRDPCIWCDTCEYSNIYVYIDSKDYESLKSYRS